MTRQNTQGDKDCLDTSNPDLLHFEAEPLRLTVLGGVKLSGLDRLRVTLKVERVEGVFAPSLRHTRDLYNASQVDELIQRVSEHFELSRADIRQMVAALTDRLEAYRMSRIEALAAPKRERPELSSSEEKQALKYLQSPNLLARTGADIGRSGVVGEEINRLLMFLAFTSRLRPRPLQVVALAASGVGKTYLQDSVGRLIPEEDRIEVTALSGNALYYFGRTELSNKLLLIEDLDGAGEVLYPLRELQSKGRLTKTVPFRDTKGQPKTMTVTVEGPVCVSGCTTREALFADNESRVLVLHLDQSEEQSKAILAYQKRLSAGVIDETEQSRIRELLRNAQRLLKPVAVRNPFAERLALPPGVARPRRSNQLYLDVIGAVAFFHQHQRELCTGEGKAYIEATLDDVEAANELMAPVLAVKADELTPACRLFLDRLKDWLSENEQTSFRSGEIRAALRQHPTSLKRYLGQLREYGYAEIEGGSRYRGGFAYRLTEQGKAEGTRAGVERFLKERLARLRKKARAKKTAA